MNHVNIKQHPVKKYPTDPGMEWNGMEWRNGMEWNGLRNEKFIYSIYQPPLSNQPIQIHHVYKQMSHGDV